MLHTVLHCVFYPSCIFVENQEKLFESKEESNSFDSKYQLNFNKEMAPVFHTSGLLIQEGLVGSSQLVNHLANKINQGPHSCGINVGPTFINFGFFSRPFRLIPGPTFIRF